jgi:hypothetical protein
MRGSRSSFVKKHLQKRSMIFSRRTLKKAGFVTHTIELASPYIQIKKK